MLTMQRCLLSRWEQLPFGEGLHCIHGAYRCKAHHATCVFEISIYFNAASPV